jgi:hypothetical protein
MDRLAAHRVADILPDPPEHLDARERRKLLALIRDEVRQDEDLLERVIVQVIADVA